MSKAASVAVLMATHDGARFLREQLDSILGQRDVEVRVIVSDDASSDATQEILAGYAQDPRVRLLEPGRFGSAQGNFLRLIRDADVDGVDAVALSDQDDIWMVDKLSRQLASLADADAVSSNVTAFAGDRRVVLQKAQPQRELDFVCESAGPGCTFVLGMQAFDLMRDVVVNDARSTSAAMHDWLIYAIVRAAGMRWTIDSSSLVDYRQHDRNVTGANLGLRQASIRLTRMRDGAFRRDCALIAEISADVAAEPLRARLLRVAGLLRDDQRRAAPRLLPLVGQLRRRARDRSALRVLIALGLW